MKMKPLVKTCQSRLLRSKNIWYDLNYFLVCYVANIVKNEMSFKGNKVIIVAFCISQLIFLYFLKVIPLFLCVVLRLFKHIKKMNYFLYLIKRFVFFSQKKKTICLSTLSLNVKYLFLGLNAKLTFNLISSINLVS